MMMIWSKNLLHIDTPECTTPFHLHYRDMFFFLSFRKKIQKEEKAILSYDLETSRFC